MKHKILTLLALFMVFALTTFYSFGLENTEINDGGEVTAYSADEQNEAGDFLVTGDPSSYSFENGVLYIKGDVTVAMKDGVSSTTQRIVVEDDSNVTLNGVNIQASGGPAIKVNAGVKATMTLADGSENTVTGASNYAGVEVQFENENKAKLIITGSGEITATGGEKSAGIGGSYTNRLSDGTYTSSYCGDIVIDGGTVKAYGTSGGAGIGSANNNGRNCDGSTQSPSFKMLTKNIVDHPDAEEPEIGSITVNGGTITAVGDAGAGIGGGNHCDSGVIVINGGTIEKAASNDGAGIGSGRGSSNYGGDADKGHGYYYADVTINGGEIKEAAGGWLSAGIGGGYECDAIITINGGTIGSAIGGNGNPESYYQGAPGIGAGYQGNVLFTMNDGTIEYAKGGWSAPGIGYGAGIQDYGSKRKKDGEHVSSNDSLIKITGGTIALAEGGMYAAGIGGGNGCPVCNIEITGGDILAKGYSDPDDLGAGGAGIGSGVGEASGLKYSRDTTENISITGGDVVAIGGWGASGIGSGAVNSTANEITISEKALIEAYADGTKFAIDTRQLNDDGSTTSITDGRNIDGNWIQGTFVRPYEDTQEGVDEQETAGLPSIKITNDASGETKELTGMPEGYRAFATNVSEPGNYTVYSDECTKVEGESVGVYFNRWDNEDKEQGSIIASNIKYVVTGNGLSDNFYLYPVKTLVVSKEVIADEAIKGRINQTLKYALWVGGSDGHYIDNSDGSRWMESIDVKSGVPQGKAMFSNIESGEYGVWELDENGNEIDVSKKPFPVGNNVVLTKIETRHGESGDNDGTISDKQWVDYITVINTYESADDPVPPPGGGDNPDNDSSSETKTGDATNILLILAFMTAALIGLLATVLLNRRARQE